MVAHGCTSSVYTMSPTELAQCIGQFYKKQCSRPDDYGRSWDLCYGFFQENRKSLMAVQEVAALHLGFYLASWGMHRGEFLRGRTYRVHKPVISALASDEFDILWQRDVGAQDDDLKLAGPIMNLAETVEKTYRRSMGTTQQKKTDTLVTKVLLGTVGCLPARDVSFERGFKAHFKSRGVQYGSLNRSFVDNILKFCIANRRELNKLRSEFLDLSGRPYPLMKLMDMCFWQKGQAKARPL